MQENVTSNVEKVDGNWLPHPEEKIFLDQLHLFMERRGSPISKVPNLGFKKSKDLLPEHFLLKSAQSEFLFFTSVFFSTVDLFLMFSIVNKMGGYEAVS